MSLGYWQPTAQCQICGRSKFARWPGNPPQGNCESCRSDAARKAERAARQRVARQERISAQRGAGFTLREIAECEDISRERVRSILMDYENVQ